MAIFYVDAQSVGADLGTKADPFKTFLQGMNAAGNGDSIHVSHTSNEIAGSQVYPCKGQIAISIDFADDSYRPGALIDTRPISDIVFLTSGNGILNSYGINYAVGDDLGAQASSVNIYDCDITLEGAGDKLDLKTGLLMLNYVNVIFGAMTSVIECSGGSLLWRGGALLGGANNLLIEFSRANKGQYIFEGVDLSLADNLVLANSTSSGSAAIFKGCLLKSGFTLTASLLDVANLVASYGSHSSNIPYFAQEVHQQGNLITETTIVKSGGSSDGTTPISMKMVTGAEAVEYVNPLCMEMPILFYASTTGIQTFEVDIISSETLQDDEAFLKASVPGITIQRDISDSLPANPLIAPTDLPLSSATWASEPATPVKQTISLTLDVKQVGWVEAHICFAKPSSTMYADLKLFDSSTRQWLAGQAYINAETAIVQPIVFQNNLPIEIVGECQTGKLPKLKFNTNDTVTLRYQYRDALSASVDITGLTFKWAAKVLPGDLDYKIDPIDGVITDAANGFFEFTVILPATGFEGIYEVEQTDGIGNTLTLTQAEGVEIRLIENVIN